MLAAAILDRLLHRLTTVSIRGESYRLKDKRKAGVRHDGGGDFYPIVFGDFSLIVDRRRWLLSPTPIPSYFRQTPITL